MEAIRQLWQGDFTSYRGTHVTVEDARIYDLPDAPIPLVFAVSGPQSLDLAQRAGVDGIMAVDPDADIVDGWAERGGDRSATWAEVPFAWHPDEDAGLDLAWDRDALRHPGLEGHGRAAQPRELRRRLRADPPFHGGRRRPPRSRPRRPTSRRCRTTSTAGFENIAIVPVGDDLAGTLDFWEREVRPQL